MAGWGGGSVGVACLCGREARKLAGRWFYCDVCGVQISIGNLHGGGRVLSWYRITLEGDLLLVRRERVYEGAVGA